MADYVSQTSVKGPALDAQMSNLFSVLGGGAVGININASNQATFQILNPILSQMGYSVTNNGQTISTSGVLGNSSYSLAQDNGQNYIAYTGGTAGSAQYSIGNYPLGGLPAGQYTGENVVNYAEGLKSFATGTEYTGLKTGSSSNPLSDIAKFVQGLGPLAPIAIAIALPGAGSLIAESLDLAATFGSQVIANAVGTGLASIISQTAQGIPLQTALINATESGVVGVGANAVAASDALKNIVGDKQVINALTSSGSGGILTAIKGGNLDQVIKNAAAGAAASTTASLTQNAGGSQGVAMGVGGAVGGALQQGGSLSGAIAGGVGGAVAGMTAEEKAIQAEIAAEAAQAQQDFRISEILAQNEANKKLSSNTPVAPVEPAVPVAPVEPVAPAVPVAPVTPVEPAVPVAPVEPVAPAVPVAPVTPVEPAVPVAPVEPVEPVKPVEPVTPSLPDITVTGKQEPPDLGTTTLPEIFGISTLPEIIVTAKKEPPDLGTTTLPEITVTGKQEPSLTDITVTGKQDPNTTDQLKDPKDPADKEPIDKQPYDPGLFIYGNTNNPGLGRYVNPSVLPISSATTGTTSSTSGGSPGGTELDPSTGKTPQQVWSDKYLSLKEGLSI
jgi:hypothetical protein